MASGVPLISHQDDTILEVSSDTRPERLLHGDQEISEETIVQVANFILKHEPNLSENEEARLKNFKKKPLSLDQINDGIYTIREKHFIRVFPNELHETYCGPLIVKEWDISLINKSKSMISHNDSQIDIESTNFIGGKMLSVSQQAFDALNRYSRNWYREHPTLSMRVTRCSRFYCGGDCREVWKKICCASVCFFMSGGFIIVEIFTKKD